MKIKFLLSLLIFFNGSMPDTDTNALLVLCSDDIDTGAVYFMDIVNCLTVSYHDDTDTGVLY